MEHKFMRLPEVKHKTGLPKSTIYKKISENNFPKQIFIGPKAVAWLESEIQKWMEEKINLSANHNNKAE